MRKAGKKIKTICCLPQGVRRDTAWELPIRSALVSLKMLHKITQEHFNDLRTLSEMTRMVGGDAYAITHADSLDRLLKPIAERGGEVREHEVMPILASAGALIEHMSAVKNAAIGRAACNAMRMAA